MSQPRYLHELADERADADRPVHAAPPVEARTPQDARPSDVNVFDAYAPAGRPESEEPARPTGARVVEGFHEAVDSVVIPALSRAADRLRRGQDRLPRRSGRSTFAWRRRLTVIAMGGAILAVAATVLTSLTGRDQDRAPTAAAGASKQRPHHAQPAGPAEAATHRRVDHEQIRMRARAYAATARAHALSRRERPTKPRVRRRPRRARPRVVRRRPDPPRSSPATPSPSPPPPSTPVVVSAPPTPAPAQPVQPAPAPQPAPAGAADEFGFER